MIKKSPSLTFLFSLFAIILPSVTFAMEDQVNPLPSYSPVEYAKPYPTDDQAEVLRNGRKVVKGRYLVGLAAVILKLTKPVVKKVDNEVLTFVHDVLDNTLTVDTVASVLSNTKNSNIKIGWDYTAVLAMVTEAAGDEITFKGQGSTNSTTRATFSQEVEYFIDDTTSVFDVYTGSEPTQMTLALQAENILTGAFAFNPRGVSQDSTTTIASATTPSQTGDVANAISNLSEPVFDSVIYTDGVQSFDITLNNNPRNQTRVGTKSLAGIGLDKIIATIATSLYFSDANAVTQKANNNESVEFYFRIDFASGGAMVWTFPNFKLNAAERPATGRATDVVLTVNGRGLKGKGANTAYTVRVDYIPA